MGDVSHLTKVAIQETRSEPNEERDRILVEAKLVMQLVGDHIDAQFFTANRPYRVKVARIVQATNGTDAGAQQCMIRKATGTQGYGAGVALLAANFDMKTAGAFTVNAPALTATAADLELAVGDRLVFNRIQAPTTGLTNSVVTVGLIPV